jgi:hypothetical protein
MSSGDDWADGTAVPYELFASGDEVDNHPPRPRLMRVLAERLPGRSGDGFGAERGGLMVEGFLQALFGTAAVREALEPPQDASG